MKKLIFAAVVIVLALSASADANTNYANRVGGYFYTSLSPYGTWIEIGFGTPVWRPTIIRKTWSPYTQGQWIYTDYGWYWDSYEDFGEIVYHYGRWYYDDFYGWIWIPDYEWAPAWVDWRYDDNYIGWAPLSPYALFSINIGIHYTYDYYVPYTHWNYVKYNHFCNSNVYNYYVAPKYKYRVHNRTKMRTNYSYYDGRVRNDGVDFDKIRDRSGRNIEKRNIVTYSNPMQRTKVRDNDKNNREIRTYIANRDDISRDGLKDVKIERTERKSTLEISKVELGRDRTIERSNDTRKVETREVNKTSREENNSNTRVKTEDTKKETNNNVTRNKVDEQRKVQERKEVEQKNSEIEKRNIEQTKRNEQIEIQRKANEQMKNTQEVKVPTRVQKTYTQDRVNDNNERKVEQRQETQKVEQRNQNNNTNVNRNTEVKRNETNTRTETKRETKTSDQNTRTRTR